MTDGRAGRGDGIGIEITQSVVRGVLLARDEPGRVKAAAEVGIASFADDRGVLDAMVRLRGELSGGRVSTRLAWFPPGSTLQRIEVTGRSGPELNAIRSSIERSDSVLSTVLVDEGPRRWMMALRWDEEQVRRLEELAERAGFVDVAVDPSPLAVARVVTASSTFVRRDAAPNESFDVIMRGLPVAACATDPVGRRQPGMATTSADVSVAVFDELVEQVDLVAQIERSYAVQPAPGDVSLRLGEDSYPPFPPHDVRAPERVCVALGAALGAAGLAGRIRPIDMQLPMVPSADALERPWVIERMSELPVREDPSPTGPMKRVLRRVTPRRSRQR